MNRTMTRAERQRWHRCHGIANDTSDPGSEAFCQDLAKRGLARCYDAMFGNLYYDLTEAGETAMFGDDENA